MSRMSGHRCRARVIPPVTRELGRLRKPGGDVVAGRSCGSHKRRSLDPLASGSPLFSPRTDPWTSLTVPPRGHRSRRSGEEDGAVGQNRAAIDPVVAEDVAFRGVDDD